MAKSGSFGKIVTYLVVLAAVGGGAWYYFKKKNDVPPQVTSITVGRGEVIQAVTATGALEAVVEVDVSSQVSGLVVDVLVDYNDQVKAGDVLARLDPSTYEQRLKSAEADLASTEANNTLVRLNTERTRELRTKNLVSQQELDQAEATLAQSNATLQTRRASVEDAKVNLARCTIYAPIDGIVLNRQTEKGKTVSASTSAPTLFVIVNNLANMQINASVAEADVGTVREGQDVNFTVDAFPNRQFRGKISQIRNNPTTQSSVVVYSTIISVDNRDLALKPGMTANVSIIVAQRNNALTIANSALRARIPAEFMPAAPTPAGGAAAAPAASGDPREQMQALMKEAGFVQGGGPPSAEVMEKVRKLAQERGIQLPTMGGGGGGGRGGRGGAGGTSAVTNRTVYRLVSPLPNLKVEAVNARLGITNGIVTEVIDGLKEGDVIVTNIITANPTASSAPATANPFAGGGRGGFGR
ncbi:MAG TPA: efflux RND transporter periplasmic adaptor subunit [Opitutaceae bacterium]